MRLSFLLTLVVVAAAAAYVAFGRKSGESKVAPATIVDAQTLAADGSQPAAAPVAETAPVAATVTEPTNETSMPATEDTVVAKPASSNSAKKIALRPSTKDPAVDKTAPASAPETSTPPVSPMGTVTAVAPTAVVEPRQAHYQVELLYSDYTMTRDRLKASGPMAGFGLGGEYDFKRSSQMVLWGIEYFTGTPSNDTTTATGAVTSKTADADFYTFSLAWGARQNPGESKFTVQESLGAAYRYFESKARDGGKGKGNKSAQEEQVFAYIPAALAMTWQANDHWQLRASAEQDFLFSGSSRTHLETVNPNMPTLRLEENTGTGTKVAMGARHNGKDLDVMGEVYYRNWQIADSSVQNYFDAKAQPKVGFTPSNTTEMVGLGLGVTY